MSRSVLFIINPISGKGRKAKIASLLEERGLKYIFTREAGDAERIARESDEDVVVAVGGDGTVNEVGRGLLASSRTLGIIPCGSGDGLARFLGISHNPQKAIDTVLNGLEIPLDAGLVNNHPFFSVCGAGLDADVSKKFAEAGRRGVLTYVEKALELWHNFTPEHYSINIDGREWEQDAVLVTVANSNQWGNEAKVAPHADCSDGLLDITVLDMFRSIEIPDLAVRLMTGHCDSSNHVHCYKGRHIVLKRSRPAPAHFDGDWFDAAEELDIRVLPHALKVMVPRNL